jgi:hypothetical protein
MDGTDGVDEENVRTNLKKKPKGMSSCNWTSHENVVLY